MNKMDWRACTLAASFDASDSYIERQQYNGWYNNLAHPSWGSAGDVSSPVVEESGCRHTSREEREALFPGMSAVIHKDEKEILMFVWSSTAEVAMKGFCKIFLIRHQNVYIAIWLVTYNLL
ncbi:hypothetical protein E2C01_040126 [Portunus trituberculatus]|uniref:Uncharacterized protein n=1 Tax=Portunus trituberculatus TaxID=210409 RepID=A0A5B7FLQ7_PORTR|nr:hypothetical protein [Portunus trituberculatus]